MFRSYSGKTYIYMHIMLKKKRLFSQNWECHKTSYLDLEHLTSGNKYKFDSNSYMIGIDNHVSKYISKNVVHFTTTLTPLLNLISEE